VRGLGEKLQEFRQHRRWAGRSSYLVVENRISPHSVTPELLQLLNSAFGFPQSTICTGVFRSTLLKKISAIFPGIRIHPCEAGYPGK
jgi:hypothetical protein